MRKLLSITLAVAMLLLLLPLSLFGVSAEYSEPEYSEPETSDGFIGDVDADGDVDVADYILIKRAVLNTFNLTEEQQKLADIDKDDDLDATDYVLVKRIVLGTYTIPNAPEKEPIDIPVIDSEANVNEQLADFVGNRNEDSGFELVIKAPETYTAGEEITVSVEVQNITAPDGLTLVNFDFFYDNTKLVIINDIVERDNGNGKALDLSLIADTKWEELVAIASNYSSLTAADIKNGVQAIPVNDGFVDAAAATTDMVFDAVTEDGKLVFNFTFDVAEDATGDIGVYIPHASVEGGYNTDAGVTPYTGNGGYVVIAEATEEEPPVESEPEVSEPEVSEPEVSEPEVSEPEVSEPEVSEPEVSEPEVSEPETSEDDTSSDAPGTAVDNPTGTNVALNKPYTGGDVAIAHPTFSANLTDGKKSNVGAYDSSWFGFWYNKDATVPSNNCPDGVGTVVIDLGEITDNLNAVRVHMWGCNASGIMAPESIVAYVSEDGTDYTELGSLVLPEGDDPAWASLALDNVSAQYVKLVFTATGTWTFINEIEVYANEAEPDESEPEEETKTVLGNIDGDEDVDAADYILIKRAVLNTFNMTEEQKKLADIDKDGDVDATDYVLVKRIVLGTYKIN